VTSLEHLVGRRYGPIELEADGSRVAAFVAATGDDPERWAGHAPPLFANAALFAAAPLFLEDPEVVPFTRSLIHSEQRFEWDRSLPRGESLEVSGVVESVRARGALHLVGFALEAGDWLRGRSMFLLSDQPAAAAADSAEPGVTDRAEVGETSLVALPTAGQSLTPVGVSASRLDLVHYAAASGDFNPIHWDHAAAREAGLEGTIVHGLLMAAWFGRVACRHSVGVDPLRSLRVRFRSPLRPAASALVTGEVGVVGDSTAELTLALAVAGTTIATGSARVTR